jgi:hypothetical protein
MPISIEPNLNLNLNHLLQEHRFQAQQLVHRYSKVLPMSLQQASSLLLGRERRNRPKSVKYGNRGNWGKGLKRIERKIRRRKRRGRRGGWRGELLGFRRSNLLGLLGVTRVLMKVPRCGEYGTRRLTTTKRHLAAYRRTNVPPGRLYSNQYTVSYTRHHVNLISYHNIHDFSHAYHRISISILIHISYFG